MRALVFALLVSCLASPVLAQSTTGYAPAEPMHSQTNRQDYRIGGAADRGLFSRLRSDGPLFVPSLRFSLPGIVRETSVTKKKTPFGGLSVFFAESWAGRDIFHLGTSLTRGQTTAGVDLAYGDDADDVRSSKVFVDYALSEQFSIGLAGTVEETEDGVSGSPQYGINAEIADGNGLFIQGGVGESTERSTIFGLAIGFKF